MKNSIDSPSFFIGKGGDDLISFGSGQPDLPPPAEVYKILPHYKDFKYGMIQGLHKLREALCVQYEKSSPEEFVITNGASEALDLVLRCVAKRGKKILVPRPYYYSYPYVVEYAGMEPVYYDLIEGKIDLEKLKEKLKEKVNGVNTITAILINSPSNPTGSVQGIEVLKEIEQLTAEQNIYVISDEVYKDLIYDRENYLIQGPKVITINSFSKTYAMCGFRVGYLFAREKEIIQEVIEMKTHTSMNTNILGQEMAYEATTVSLAFYEEQVAIWKDRRDTIYGGLKELGLDLWTPEGAFYVFPKLQNANKVVNDLYFKYKMITYDGGWFGAPERVRFSYALNKEKIKEGLARLKQYLANDYQKPSV